MTTQAWPSGLFVLDNSVRIKGASRSGGRSIASGAEQAVQSDAGYWCATITLRVRKAADVVALRGLLAALDGRSFAVLVPCCERARSPWGLTNPRLVSRPAPTVRTNALERDTTVDVTMPSSTLALAAGQRFSIAERMYEIRGGVGAGTNWTVTVRPPLRANITAGDTMQFEQPVCAMRLASDDTGEVNLAQNRFSTVTLDFEEIL